MDTSETQSDLQQRRGRLAFAGVIVLLGVIYMVRNIDRYEDLNTEFRYRELVEMVEPIQDTVEAVLLSDNYNDIAFLDSGEAELPEEVLVSEEAHGISVIDGRIIATWMKDNSELDGVTYILTPKVENNEIQWSITGTFNKFSAHLIVSGSALSPARKRLSNLERSYLEKNFPSGSSFLIALKAVGAVNKDFTL